MNITVKFTDVYDGGEHPRTETLDVPTPTSADDGSLEVRADLDEWAETHLFPHTGTGQEHDESGYFAEIVECADMPELVAMEFSWGV